MDQDPRLVHLVVQLPFNMTYAVDFAVRRMLHLVGRDDLANADDMEIVVRLAIAVVTTAIGAAVVWGGAVLVKRAAVRRSRV